MSRIRIQLPDTFIFSTLLPIRITDINYGGHLGNDTILTLIHEARMQFLIQFGYTEMEFEDVSLIMSDAAIEFKAECFYGDTIRAYVGAGDFSRAGFNVYYKLVKGSEETLVALAKTGMICYNYERKKVVSVPDKAKEKLSG